MDNKTNANQKPSVDMETLIEKIRHVDANNPNGIDVDGPHTGVSSADEAIARLKTLQLIKDTKKNAERMSRFSDAFANPATKSGWGQENLINATEYPLTRLTQNWQLLTSLYRSSWIVQRVCNAIPEDALTDMKIEAPDLSEDEISRLNEEIRTTHLREQLLEAMRWGRLYGGAAGIIMVMNQEEDLSQPLDVNNVLPNSFRGIYVVDRWSGIYPSLELVQDERDPDFGLPAYYEVRDENGVGNYQVHHSRVLRFCGAKMPFWEQVAEQYWGMSAIEPMYDELVKHDNIKYNIANLTFKANLNVLSVENLDQMFATSSTMHQRRMFQMLSAINTIENSLGIRLINSTDNLQQFQYAFSGLPEVADIAMMDMAGATGIPATRLFGRSPAGMNATGESDEKMYRQTLENVRAIQLMPALERIISVLCRSAIGRFPKGAKFKLPPLIELTQVDKLGIIDQQSGATERLFQSNLITGDVVLKAFRDAQLNLDITSPITDEAIDAVKGKYMNDLQQQADPYGGAAQSAGEASGYGEDGQPAEGEEVEAQGQEQYEQQAPEEGEEQQQEEVEEAQQEEGEEQSEQEEPANQRQEEYQEEEQSEDEDGEQRRGDSMYRKDSLRTRSRHIDGIVGTIIQKVKAYYENIKSSLENMSGGRKVLFLIGKTIKIVSLALTAKEAASFVAYERKYKALIEELNKNADKLGGVFAMGAKKEIEKNIESTHIPAIKMIIKRSIIRLLSAAIGFAAEKFSLQ